MERNQSKIRNLSLALGLVFGCSVNAAPSEQVCSSRSFHFVKTVEGEQQLDLTYLAKLSVIAQMDLLSTAQFIPIDMSSSNEPTSVGRQILEHSLAEWFEHSEVGRNVVGQNLQSPVVYATDVQHSIDFEVQTSQALAAFKYSGYVDAKLQFKPIEQRLNLELSHSLGTESRMVFNHSEVGAEVRDIVGFRINW